MEKAQPRYRILMTDCIFLDQDIERHELEAIDAELILAPAQDEDTLVSLANDVDGMIVTFAEITERVINACRKCRIIVRTGIGYNNIDIEAASARGIMVANIPDYCIDGVADHTMALILSCLRKTVTLSASVKSGQWNINLARPIARFNTLTAGLVGFGNIARAVARRLQPFGISVATYDPYVSDELVESAGVEKFPSLLELARKADILSLHSPLNNETRNMINKNILQEMKRSAILINTSRGPLINEQDLNEAISMGSIAGCGLDVMASEPCDMQSPLLKHDHVIVTPHVAFYSEESDLELRTKAAQQVVLTLTQGHPRYWVNKKS
ncbi:MAG: C-terminal binding protein [Ruminococcaceae bacterium]|nr:C-terminal binding protein [Oscillospiraceae bacterium]